MQGHLQAWLSPILDIIYCNLTASENQDLEGNMPVSHKTDIHFENSKIWPFFLLVNIINFLTLFLSWPIFSAHNLKGFIHILVNIYFLSTYYMAITVLDAGITAVNKTEQNFHPVTLTF